MTLGRAVVSFLLLALVILLVAEQRQDNKPELPAHREQAAVSFMSAGVLVLNARTHSYPVTSLELLDRDK